MKNDLSILHKIEMGEETVFSESTYLDIQQIIHDCLRNSVKEGLPHIGVIHAEDKYLGC